MANYNSASIDLEDIFSNMETEDQKEFLSDMVYKLNEEDEKEVVKNGMDVLMSSTVVDVVVETFEDMDESDRKETAERIVGAMTDVQRMELKKYLED